MAVLGHLRREEKIRHRTWKWAGACIAAVALAWYALRAEWLRRSFDWRLFAASISSLHWWWVFLCLFPVAATYYGRALRWAVFLEPLKRRSSVWNLVSATIIGFAAITVFGRPGELVRPYVIAIEEQVPLASQLSICVLERIFDLLMALLLFGFALTRTHSLGVHGGPHIARMLDAAGWIVVWTSLALLLTILSFRRLAAFLRRGKLFTAHFLPARRFPAIEKWIAAFAKGLESARSDRSLVRIGLYSAWIWLCIAAFYWCVVHAFDGTANLSVPDVLMMTGFVSFGAIVQLPGIGGGIQVVTVLVLTELFGVKLEVAASLAALVWIVTLALVPAGLGLALHMGLSWRRLRSAASEAAASS
jgi:uncharacterized membrane protein YbhN (UPF0104 family)